MGHNKGPQLAPTTVDKSKQKPHRQNANKGNWTLVKVINQTQCCAKCDRDTSITKPFHSRYCIAHHQDLFK